MSLKSKITKILNSKENSKRKVPVHMAKSKAQKLKHQKRMENKCHIADLVQAFSYVENGGFVLVLWQAKPITCMACIKDCTMSTF